MLVWLLAVLNVEAGTKGRNRKVMLPHFFGPLARRLRRMATYEYTPLRRLLKARNLDRLHAAVSIIRFTKTVLDIHNLLPDHGSGGEKIRGPWGGKRIWLKEKPAGHFSRLSISEDKRRCSRRISMSGSILGKRLREERRGNTQGMVFHETAIVAVKGSSLWEDLGMWEAGENDGEIDERRPMGKGILMNSVGKNAVHFEEGVFREYLHSTTMMTPTKRFMALKLYRLV